MTRTIALLSLLPLVAAAETVEIRSAADWDSFATRVNDGEATLNAVLMRDVTLAGSSPRCGFPETRRFRGEFDGNGKTLTVGIKVTNAGAGNPAAPFAYVSDGCHIHDLRTAGTIETDGKFAAGLIGVAEQLDNGLVMLERCRSSVAIACTVDGDATSGGLLGCSRSSYPIIVVVDCLFDGSIVGANANSCGGLVGWRQSATVGTRNSLFAPSELSLDETDAFTLVRNGFKSAADCSNTWYTRVYGEAQGLDGRGKTAAELVAALGGNWVAVEEDGVTKAVPRFVVSQNDNIPDPNRGILAFTYQGTLRDAQGNALAQKSHTIAFRIYGQATGGSPHWGRRHRVTLDDDGLFALEISDVAGEEIEGVAGTGLADVLADNAGTTLYFGLAVDGGEAEISPRQKLLASPAATCAADTANARGDMSVAGDAAAEGAHVAEAVHADAVVASDGISAGSATAFKSATVGGDLETGGAMSGGGSIPVGGIIPWYGAVSDIPPNWRLCDGAGGTPDLRGRFVVGIGGSGDYRVDARGGADTVTLTVAQMPKHSHVLWGRSSGYALAHNNSHEVITYATKDWGSWAERINDTTDAGGGKAHENRPPFYALCYIMRVK